MNANRVSALLALVIGAAVWMTLPSGGGNKWIDESSVSRYEVIERHQNSVEGRNRLEVVITAPHANSHKELAMTAAHVAFKETKKHQADVCWVHIVPSEELRGSGYLLANATYAADGRGTSGTENFYWKVYSAREQLPKDLKTAAELWIKHREQFLGTDGLLKEKDLRQFLISEKGLPVDFGLPMPKLEIYNIKTHT